MTSTAPSRRYRPVLWSVLALPILAAAVAMQFDGSGVDWTPGDFVAAAILLGGTGLALELLLRNPRGMPYRLASLLAAGGLLLLVWANLAVGIVGSENDPFNAFYFLAVPLVVLGAILSRLKPSGMAATMALATAVPAILAVAAIILGKHLQPMDSLREVLVANGLFVTLFGASTLLYRQAAIREPR